MVIELAPDYDLFVKILFVIWVFTGFLKLIAGMAQVDRPNPDKYGFAEVLSGSFILLLGIWVVTSA